MFSNLHKIRYKGCDPSLMRHFLIITVIQCEIFINSQSLLVSHEITFENFFHTITEESHFSKKKYTHFQGKVRNSSKSTNTTHKVARDWCHYSSFHLLLKPHTHTRVYTKHIIKSSNTHM